jgi:hypothetical protein
MFSKDNMCISGKRPLNVAPIITFLGDLFHGDEEEKMIERELTIDLICISPNSLKGHGLAGRPGLG